jgi:eukaryotic translation initiation factor 2C
MSARHWGSLMLHQHTTPIDSVREAGKSNHCMSQLQETNETPRCYLRDYFAPAPNSPLMNESKQLKPQFMKELKIARENKYKAKRTSEFVGGKTRMMKSTEEKSQEKLDSLEVDRRVQAHFFQKARTAFYKGADEKNPWHPNLSGTMFWM